MNKKDNKRKQFFANKMHRELFLLASCAAIVPTLLTAVSLFYLIFHLTAEQMIFPEAIAYNIIPVARRVAMIMYIAVPLTVTLILTVAHKVTHRIVGPFERVVRELEEHIQGTRTGPIVLRNNDKLKPLVDKINVLLKT
ncbi:hypothetical protein ACFL38_04650 [Candidatus Omnitrophota bacterium]